MKKYIFKRIALIFELIYTAFLVMFSYLIIQEGILLPIYRYTLIAILGLIAVIFFVRISLSKNILAILFRIIIFILLSIGLYLAIKFIYDIKNFHKTVYNKDFSISKSVDTNKEPFNVYLTGADNSDDINKNSRSDVNLLLTINPEEKKILITNTPRDSYLGLGGDDNKLDKLTHAAIYGVDESIKTLENLYGIKINYAAKFNYNSVRHIIDSMGGIDVNAEVDFIADKKTPIKKGLNHLDGEGALNYVRERKSFIDGDLARGRHQQEVFNNVFTKLIKLKDPRKLSVMMKKIEGDVLLNLPLKDILGVVNNELTLFGKKGWTFEKQSVYGDGEFMPSYASGGQMLSVMILDDNVVEEAKNKIKEFSR